MIDMEIFSGYKSSQTGKIIDPSDRVNSSGDEKFAENTEWITQKSSSWNFLFKLVTIQTGARWYNFETLTQNRTISVGQPILAQNHFGWVFQNCTNVWRSKWLKVDGLWWKQMKGTFPGLGFEFLVGTLLKFEWREPCWGSYNINLIILKWDLVILKKIRHAWIPNFKA